MLTKEDLQNINKALAPRFDAIEKRFDALDMRQKIEQLQVFQHATQGKFHKLEEALHVTL